MVAMILSFPLCAFLVFNILAPLCVPTISKRAMFALPNCKHSLYLAGVAYFNRKKFGGNSYQSNLSFAC